MHESENAVGDSIGNRVAGAIGILMMLTNQRPRPARSLQQLGTVRHRSIPPKSMTRLSQLPNTTIATAFVITTLPATTATAMVCEDCDGDDDGDDDDNGEYLSGLRHNSMMRMRMV